jgi:hypothetical protein
MGTTSWIRDFRHPELMEGEQFLGNFTQDEFKRSQYEKKRLGDTAYDIFNRVIPAANGLYPMFVSAKEYAAIRAIERRDFRRPEGPQPKASVL